MSRKPLYEAERLQGAAKLCRSRRNDDVGGDDVMAKVATWIETSDGEPTGLPISREDAFRIINTLGPGRCDGTINGQPMNDDHCRGALLTVLCLAAGSAPTTSNSAAPRPSSDSGRDVGRRAADEAWRQTLRDGEAEKQGTRR